MKDTVIKGISKTEIRNVRTKINDQKLFMELDVRFPKIILEGDYKGRGGYNEFKVNSAGHAKIRIGKNLHRTCEK